MRKLLFAFLVLTYLIINPIVELQAQDEPKACPETCVEKQKNCELSCSQIVGGGAKSEKRRECKRDCEQILKQCKGWCINPTPRPTLPPERYHDKSCPKACELKEKDCREVCTKYIGGGAKSEKRNICNIECAEELKNCKDWCVNPTPRPTLRTDPLADEPCSEKCRYKKLDCESGCSVYMGGGAKSGKKSKCMNECKDFNKKCMSECSEIN